MTIVVDASALVAMIVHEPEAILLGEELDRHEVRLCCAIGWWEAARAIVRQRTIGVVEASVAVQRFLMSFDVAVVPIGTDEAQMASRAHALYGKGTGHPARLNMGDCFAYACAKVNRARLLYKGDDFAMTDLA